MSSDSHTAMKLHSEVEAATILEPGLSLSPYFSARIQSLSERRSNFADKVEFEIESSKSHWTELSKKENEPKELWSDDEEVMESNQVVFERLKEHPEWGPFFRRSWYDLEIGEKIGEGGQAEIFAASGTHLRNGTKRDLVVKAFKDGYFLENLQRWWPPGLAKAALPYRYFTGSPGDFTGVSGLCWALDVQLLKGDKFAFVFDRHWGDLRKLIDTRMLVTNGTPPFSFRTTLSILYQIAVGMENMHKFRLLHRDLKAANVLVVDEVIQSQTRPSTKYKSVSVLVADFESSAGTVGTGFWRAPEILLALRNRSISEPGTFTQQTDVYSYAMTCYEVITGCVPFEDRSLTDIDDVLRGERPVLPDDTSPILVDLVGKCWHEDPLQRPSFRAIAETLLSLWLSAVNKTMAKMFIDEFRAPTSDEERKVPPKSAISESDPTPLSEAGVIKFLRERPHWRGKLEHEIWSSESHWTELTKESSCDIEDRQQQAHLEIHERLKKHSEWSDYFRNKDLRIGKKIGGGGEADVFESLESDAEFAVKVFKSGYPVQSLIQVRPPGRSRHYFYRQISWRISFTLGTVLLKDKKLAFFFQRHWGDLRKFLDQRILENRKNNKRVTPFNYDTIMWFMLSIAMGMRNLHRLGIVHGDLKSSNILLGVTGKLHDFSTLVVECNHVYISDFESSAGTVGTGLWRAPEILLALKNGSSKPETFTAQSDVYSYAMTCYEVITGEVPFDCHQPSASDYDAVLRGKRPAVHYELPLPIANLISQCWHEDPLQRPSFEVIGRKLDRLINCNLPLREVID